MFVNRVSGAAITNVAEGARCIGHNSALCGKNFTVEGDGNAVCGSGITVIGRNNVIYGLGHIYDASCNKQHDIIPPTVTTPDDRCSISPSGGSVGSSSSSSSDESVIDLSTDMGDEMQKLGATIVDNVNRALKRDLNLDVDMGVRLDRMMSSESSRKVELDRSTSGGKLGIVITSMISQIAQINGDPYKLQRWEKWCKSQGSSTTLHENHLVSLHCAFTCDPYRVRAFRAAVCHLSIPPFTLTVLSMILSKYTADPYRLQCVTDIRDHQLIKDGVTSIDDIIGNSFDSAVYGNRAMDHLLTLKMIDRRPVPTVPSSSSSSCSSSSSSSSSSSASAPPLPPKAAERSAMSIPIPDAVKGIEPSAPASASDDSKCRLCMDRLTCTVVVPCGHVCLCVTCARVIGTTRTGADGRGRPTCPICRDSISGIYRTHPV